MTNVWTRARGTAERTPPDRNRYVDFLRAASIVVVVFGHWLGAAPQLTDQGLEVGRILEVAPRSHYVTWFLQVMPIFFFVGGYSNAMGWRAARRDGLGYPAWLRARLRRLLLPVLPLLAAWGVGAPIAVAMGLDPELLSVASLAALVPVWFLATYVVVVTVAPVALVAWERWGWGSLVAPLAAATLVDVATIYGGVPYIGFLNFLLVWGSVHQLGYAWAHDRWGPPGRRLAVSAVGLAALISLVSYGPYPVSMVGVDTNAVNNTYPPRIALFALGLFQAGLLLAVEGPARRWLEQRRRWTAVVAINSSIMTLYLWHMTALVAVIGVLVGLGGPGIRIPILTSAWWVTRPLWLAGLIVATLPFLWAFGRFERPGPERRPAPPLWKPFLGVAVTCTGLAFLALRGVIDEAGLNWPGLLLPFVAAVAGGVGGSRWAARRGRLGAQAGGQQHP